MSFKRWNNCSSRLKAFFTIQIRFRQWGILLQHFFHHCNSSNPDFVVCFMHTIILQRSVIVFNSKLERVNFVRVLFFINSVPSTSAPSSPMSQSAHITSTHDDYSNLKRRIYDSDSILQERYFLREHHSIMQLLYLRSYFLFIHCRKTSSPSFPLFPPWQSNHPGSAQSMHCLLSAHQKYFSFHWNQCHSLFMSNSFIILGRQ